MKPLTLVLIVVAALRAQQDPNLEVQRLLAAGQFVEAEAAVQGALKVRSGDGQLWNLLGVVQAQRGDAAAAEKSFQKAVGFAPRLESAWLNLGRLYQMGAGGQPDVEKSLAAYETVLRINAASAEAHHQSALLLFLKRDFTNSLKHLNKLPPADQSSRTALIIRCADQAALGESAPALASAGKLISDPGLVEDDVMPVLAVIAASDDAVTIRIIEVLDARQLATEKSLVLLAAAYEHRDDWKRSRATLEKCARRTPESVQPLMELARVSWRQKDFEGAIGYLAHARDLEPKNGAIHFLFAITCNEMRLPVEAKMSLEKALEIEPENAYYNYAMGSMLLQWSNKSLATPYLEKFVAMRPDDARGHLALATSYAGAGREPEARAQLDIPLKDPQTRAGAAYLLGSLARKEDDFESAVRYFQQVVAREPNSPEAHSELGAIFLVRDEVDAARRETNLALAADPQNYRANDTLMKLYRMTNDSRLAAQVEKVKKLMKDRDEEFTLLHRTIEFKAR